MSNEELQFLSTAFEAERPHWTNRYDAMDQAIRALKQAREAFPEEKKDTNSEKPKEWSEEADGVSCGDVIKRVESRKDYPYIFGWRKNREGNKPEIKHSVIMLTTHGVAEGEWLGDEWCQYRWSCKVKDNEVLYWGCLSDLENLEKEE